MPIPKIRMSKCCDWRAQLIGIGGGVVDEDTPWAGNQSLKKKLYVQAGQFTSTISTSVSVSSFTFGVFDIGWDGTNTPWIGSGFSNNVRLQSGQFSSTMKTSGATPSTALSISWDGTNTPIGTPVFGGAAKLILVSGQFTSTIKTSEDVSGVTSGEVQGISYDDPDTPWCDDKLYLQSGQFTSTIKTSQSLTPMASGISWDGTNTPWADRTNEKLMLTSGQFSSTIKTSEDISAKNSALEGINTNILTVG